MLAEHLHSLCKFNPQLPLTCLKLKLYFHLEQSLFDFLYHSSEVQFNLKKQHFIFSCDMLQLSIIFAISENQPFHSCLSHFLYFVFCCCPREFVQYCHYLYSLYFTMLSQSLSPLTYLPFNHSCHPQSLSFVLTNLLLFFSDFKVTFFQLLLVLMVYV